MKKNLIFTSFHWNPKANTAHAVAIETYLKNIFVALVSAKRNNPNDDVCLIVTEQTKNRLPDFYEGVLKQEGVSIKTVEFDSFQKKEEQAWSFSFYRLSLIKKICSEKEYSNICSIDSDTYTVSSFANIWNDARSFVLLLDLNHSPDIQQARDQRLEASPLLNEEVSYTNYGGEFVAGSVENLALFVEVCEEVYQTLLQKKIHFKHGDETVLYIAAAECQNRPRITIKNASPYVARYWTSRHFYLVSSNHKFNPVCIWHLPDEKKNGLQRLYFYYKKHRRFPTDSKCARVCGMNTHAPLRPLMMTRRMLYKILKMDNRM